MSVESRIGLALGGGGARGMVHILVCEVFDELGIKPAVIAGTSIAAIIGAGYAAGFSGREMREAAVSFYGKRRDVLARLWKARPLAFTDLLRGRSMTRESNCGVRERPRRRSVKASGLAFQSRASTSRRLP